MKRIILCEGKNDLIFLNELLKPMSNEVYMVEKDKIGKKGGESNVIRDFISDPHYDKRTYLVKSEGGKGEVEKYFRKFFRQFGWYTGRLINLGVIDRDNREENTIFEELRGFIKTSKLDLNEKKEKYNITFTTSGNKEYVLFIIPPVDLEYWVEKFFGKVDDVSIRELARRTDIEWITELKKILFR